MAFVVTFNAYTPPARSDGQPWTLIQIEEASAKTGPWTVIDTVAISPVDTDPASPRPRDFSTDVATFAASWYQVTFLDATNNQAPFRPVYSGASIAPSLADIARSMRSRLADDGGQPLATFTDATRPTRDDVEGFIKAGIRAVRLKVGAVQDELAEDAREVVELYATARAELASWPEQTGNTASPYQALMDAYEAALEVLAENASEVAAGGEEGTADDFPRPIGLFPPGGRCGTVGL